MATVDVDDTDSTLPANSTS